MIKDTFFDLPRFMNLCRKEMVENWRTNVLRIVLIYGVMAVVLIWNGYYEYKYHDTGYFIKNYPDGDAAWEFVLGSFFFFLFGFGCVNASLTMEKMKSKTRRVSALMTPATPFEKFFSSWLISTIVFLVVFLIAFTLADYTRVMVYSMIYPDISDAINTVHLGDLAGREGYCIFRKTHELLCAFSMYLFAQSLFVLGSSVWPKNSLIKTFFVVTIIVLIYIMTGALLGEALYERGNGMNYGYLFSSWTEEQGFLLVSGCFVFFALVNWVLAYFRFKESEIIQRM